jgi:hypothetical protein
MKRLVLLVVLLSFAPVSAQELGVARMSLLSGGVTVERGDSGDASTGMINAPLFTGDQLTTRPGSHAEAQLDGVHTLRIGPDTRLIFTRLEPARYALQLERGVLALRVSRDTSARFEIETPSCIVRPNAARPVRCRHLERLSYTLRLRSGRAEVVAGSRALSLVSGDGLTVNAAKTELQLHRLQASDFDDFDAWNDERDRSAVHEVRDRYVGDEIVGADELDGYGRWMYADGYGAVWVPYQSVGWAPYTEGRWVREPYYGLTWVSDEPWGWAPYHYGRWFYYSPAVGWAWFPDPLSLPAVWQPALVAFFSFGQGGFSGAVGDVGWVPLAPHEPCEPWWGAGSGVAGDPGGYSGNHMRTYRNLNAPGVFKRRFTLSADDAQRVHIVRRAAVPAPPSMGRGAQFPGNLSAPSHVPPRASRTVPERPVSRGVSATPQPRVQPELRRTMN